MFGGCCFRTEMAGEVETKLRNNSEIIRAKADDRDES